jgi:hypothetical protein
VLAKIIKQSSGSWAYSYRRWYGCDSNDSMTFILMRLRQNIEENLSIRKELEKRGVYER